MGFVIRCGRFLDFWIGLGVLSAFVAREARRGFGFGLCGGKWTPALALVIAILPFTVLHPQKLDSPDEDFGRGALAYTKAANKQHMPTTDSVSIPGVDHAW